MTPHKTQILGVPRGQLMGHIISVTERDAKSAQRDE